MSSPIAYACAAEPTPGWVARVETLAWSLRTFGGASAGAEIHACFAGDVDDALVAPLAGLDVRVHRVERFDERLAYANKLRLLELGGQIGSGVEAVAMIDCDIVFAGDPGAVLPAGAVAAKPADRDPLDARGWSRLCGALGIEVPPRDVVACTTGRPMPRYFNSGVVVVPRAAQATLQEAWARWLRRIVDLLAARADVVPHARRFYADQYALMAAMAEHDGVALPTAANCPTHLRLHPAATSGPAPAILHYHGRVWPDGLLQEPADPWVRPAAARFNAARARALGIADRGLRAPPVGDRIAEARARVEDAVRATTSFTRVRAAVTGASADRVA